MLDADEKYFKEHNEPLFSKQIIGFQSVRMLILVRLPHDRSLCMPLRAILCDLLSLTRIQEEAVDYNISTTAKYLKRSAPMKQWLEMEIGITGGEEDGVNNESVDNNSLYTQPEDIYEIYKTLIDISPYFSIAAGFGNVHGVYKPGNVKLHPELLSKHQKYVKEKINAKEDKPVFLVFHGGSGSSKEEFKEGMLTRTEGSIIC